MKKFHHSLLLLVSFCAILTLVSAECSVKGSGSNGSTNSTAVTLGFKGSGGEPNTRIRGTVTYHHEKVNAPSSHTVIPAEYDVLVDAAGNYLVQRTFTIRHGNYYFLVETPNWLPNSYEYNVTAAGQIQIYWTRGSNDTPVVTEY